MDLIKKSTSKEQYLNLSPFTGFSRSFNILYLTHIYTTRTWSSIKINQLQAYNCIFFLAVQPFIISVAASNPSLKEIYGLDRRMNFHRSCDSGESWRQITDGYFNKTLTESQLIKAKALPENLVSEMPTSDLTALADSTGTTWGGEWFEKKFHITDARRASHYLLCCVGEGGVGEDHMVFRWSGRGISLRQQSLRGDLSKLTASWMPVRWDQVTQPNPLTPQMINNKRSPVDPVDPVSVGCLLFLVHALPWKVYAFPLFCFPVSGRGIHVMTAGSDAWSLVGTWKCCGQ